MSDLILRAFDASLGGIDTMKYWHAVERVSTLDSPCRPSYRRSNIWAIR